MELDTPVSSARKIEPTRSIDTSHPWWNGNVAIDFSTDEWGYILNGLSSLVETAHMWGWAGTAVETDIRNIMDRIEKNIGTE
jgi:hypothetical protein